jgi:hypothetical protein
VSFNKLDLKVFPRLAVDEHANDWLDVGVARSRDATELEILFVRVNVNVETYVRQSALSEVERDLRDLGAMGEHLKDALHLCAGECAFPNKGKGFCV